MADGEKISPPCVIWAQRKDVLYLTINLEDCKNPTIELSETFLKFSGKGGPNNDPHQVEIQFYGEVVPPESKYVVQSRNIPMVIKKKDTTQYWPRLLKQLQKVHWLKTDFDKWKEEDESEDDESNFGGGGGMGGMGGGMGGMDLNSMMANMGNFNAGGDNDDQENGGDDEAPDSDDEEMPDLQ